MGLRILLQESVHEEEMGADSQVIWDSVAKLAKKVARPDTTVTLRHVPKDPSTPDSLKSWPWPQAWPCLQPIREPAIVNSVLQAEDEGFDAVAINCALDPGLHRARGMLTIPVTSVTESGILIAQLLGRRFALMAPSDTITAALEENLHFLRVEDRAIKYRPVRHFEMIFGLIDALNGKPERLIDDFEKAATEAIRDGADVIVLACGWLGCAFSLNGYMEVRGANVPIVDGTATALKLAELLADLQKSIGLKKTSRPTSYYLAPPPDILDEARRRLADSLG